MEKFNGELILIVSQQVLQSLLAKQVLSQGVKTDISGKSPSPQLIKNSINDQFSQSSVFKTISSLIDFSSSTNLSTIDSAKLFKTILSDPLVSTVVDNLNLKNTVSATNSNLTQTIANNLDKNSIDLVGVDFNKPEKIDSTSVLKQSINQQNQVSNLENISLNAVKEQFAKIENKLAEFMILKLSNEVEKLQVSNQSNNQEAKILNTITSSALNQYKLENLDMKNLSVSFEKALKNNFPQILKESVEVSIKLIEGNLKHLSSSPVGELFVDKNDDKLVFVSKTMLDFIEKEVIKQPLKSIDFSANVNSSVFSVINFISSQAISYPQIASKDIFSSLFMVINKFGLQESLNSSLSNQKNEVTKDLIFKLESLQKTSDFDKTKVLKPNNLQQILNEFVNLKNKGSYSTLKDSTQISQLLKEESVELSLRKISEVSKEAVVLNNIENKSIAFPFIFGDIRGLFIKDNDPQNLQEQSQAEVFTLELETSNLGKINVNFDVGSFLGINFVSDNATTRMLLRKEKRELFEKLENMIDKSVVIGIR